MSSAAAARVRSGLPSLNRRSIWILRPSVQPSCEQLLEPCEARLCFSVSFAEEQTDAPLRTLATKTGSICALAPCGDVTQGGEIPWMRERPYARRHDRLPSDS